MKSYIHSRHSLNLYSPAKTRGIKEFDRSNKCCLQEGGDLPGPRGPLWKNRHRSHSSRLPSRDGENNDFSPTESCKFYHLIFLVFLSDFFAHHQDTDCPPHPGGEVHGVRVDDLHAHRLAPGQQERAHQVRHFFDALL